MKWLAERLVERSTWAGMLMIAAAVGVRLQPELADAIMGVGIALGGLLFVITKDKK